VFLLANIRDSFGWAGVELRHLVTLRTVAEERSLAAAARRLGYSQPAVSQQLAALERLLETRLVDRRGGIREASLTDAGRLVLLHASAILARAQAADAELHELKSGAAGTLRLGLFPSVGARVVPPLLQRLAERWPRVDVQLVEDASDRRLLDQVEAAELDLTFAMLPLRDGPFSASELLRDPYVVLVPADSQLAARRRPLYPGELASLPLIGFRHTQAYPQDFLEAHGISARVRFRSDDNETVVGLVAAGMGVALVPRLTVDPARHDVVQLQIGTEFPARLIAVVWHRDREPTSAAKDLIEIAGALSADVPAQHGGTRRGRSRRSSSRGTATRKS
jgi:DNA-binding transcriptional LysR family regulator